VISHWKHHKISFLFVLLIAIFYWVFAYQLIRTDFPKLLGLYLALFAFTYQLSKSIGHNFKLILILGIGFRLLFIVAMPNLSQDFYRFIWDGYLTLNGNNPYLFTPKELMATSSPAIPNAELLYEGMGALSASNHSNYPPINQWCFALANLVPGNSILSSVIGMRILIIMADVGILIIGSKLLKAIQLPVSNLLWYFLNPFIIIELTGNLHFEGVMMFFLILSIYLLTQKKLLGSAICFGVSISVKLIPLMLLPLLFSYYTGGLKRWNKGWKSPKNYRSLFIYYAITGLVLTLSFIPYITGDFIDNYSSTVGLWFTNFEFNASVYYIARGIGFLITGYNEIALIGKFLPLITVGVIGYFALFKDLEEPRALVVSMLFVMSLYLLMSTTVHPWYLTGIVTLSVFTNYKYPVIWSLTVVLSYFAYSQTDFKENYWIIAIEYLIVAFYFFKNGRKLRQFKFPILPR
jgi:alpha-1,6-mannosyltransferase